MKRIILLCGLATCSPAIASHATVLDFFQLPVGGAAYEPALACGPDGVTLVVYNVQTELLQTFVEAQFVPTQTPQLPTVMDPPVTLGAGHDPRVAWTRSGWVCAYASAGMLQVRTSDTYGNWDEITESIQIGGAIVDIDLWGVGEAGAGPDCLAAVQTWLDPPFGGFATVYLQRSYEGWSVPETVVPESDLIPRAQVVPTAGMNGPYPTLFYLLPGEGTEPHLWRTTLVPASGWSIPTEVFGDGVSSPTEIWGEFEAIRHDDGRLDLLGLGATPTCPCRAVVHQDFDEGWSESEVLTVHHDFYDQAYSPRLAAGPAGRTYAFWAQEGSDGSLNPRSRMLEYQVLEEGAWTDRSDELASLNPPAPGGALDIVVDRYGRPVLAWTRVDTVGGVEQPREIWIARRNAWSPVAETPPLRTRLEAWPNPFNPIVKLALTAPEPGPVTVAIHDARGRRLATVLQADLAAGRRELIWNGTDDAGRPLPSGVYFARAETVAGATVTKLVLAR